MRITRVVLLGIVAALTTLAFATAASAATVDIEPSELTATASGELTFSGGGTSVTCNFTMSGTVVESVTGRENEWRPIGSIAGSEEGACTNADSVTLLVEAGNAWGVEARFDLLEGGEIRLELRISGAEFLLDEINAFFTPSCLFSGEVIAEAALASNPGSIRTLEFPSQNVGLVATLDGICPSSGNLAGTMAINDTTVGITNLP